MKITVEELWDGIQEFIEMREETIENRKRDGEGCEYFEGEVTMLKWVLKVLDDE